MNVVFDLDGTLSDAAHRVRFLQQKPKDWEAWHKACIDDAPMTAPIKVYKALRSRGHFMQIWTGRSESVRDLTIEWLNRHYIRYRRLLMRPEGDHSHDTKLKEYWMHRYGTPDLVFEDRNRMVESYRKLNVTCFQVAEGDF